MNQLTIFTEKVFLELLNFPSLLSPKCILDAKKIAIKIVKELKIVGILAVEMFILKNEKIIVNEIAPRHITPDIGL